MMPNNGAQTTGKMIAKAPKPHLHSMVKCSAAFDAPNAVMM